ncbi:MAG TPA: hypothetical protein VFO85_10430, partial [Vicinamibacteria bacterium]|nr:hypothetical protein [Vicinamibacteria bacterium]
PFPLALRVAALVWLVVFMTAYWRTYGPANFLHLCDVAVILTCIGLWRGSALLLSTQAVSSLVVDLAWNLDFLWRLLLGRHLIGGTEYMWDARFPLAVRAMSLFHLVWPVLLLWALRRVGYDRRGLLIQSLIAAALLTASRFVLPEVNINFAQRDPFWGRQWGPGAAHVALTWAVLCGVVYWPTHRLLLRLFPRSEVERGAATTAA